MKKTFFLFTLMLTSIWMNAQTLYAPLQQFADVCLQEKKAIRSKSINDSDRFELLYTCMQTFTNLPLKTGEKILHSSNSLSLEQMSGHIVFSPSFINMYLQQNMTDSYSHVIPYVPSFRGRAWASKRGQDEYVYYHNSLLKPNSTATFSYNVRAGEQQLIVIAEDNTPLTVEITSNAGTSFHINTNVPQEVASQIWNEEKYAEMHITVTNPTNKYVSFVIAVH